MACSFHVRRKDADAESITTRVPNNSSGITIAPDEIGMSDLSGMKAMLPASRAEKSLSVMNFGVIVER